MTHHRAKRGPGPSPLILAGTVALATAAAGCADIELQRIGDPNSHGGSTLPVPDMTAVTFSQDGLSGPLVISGAPGSMWADGEVNVTNRTTGTTDHGFATAGGTFVVPLTDATTDQTVTVATGDGGTAAPSNWPYTVGANDPITLQLTPGGDEPPAPIDLLAAAVDMSPGAAAVTGSFAVGDMPLQVRVLHPVTGEVFVAETTLDLNRRNFELQVEARAGDELWVHGVRTDVADTPGPFARTTVAP